MDAKDLSIYESIANVAKDIFANSVETDAGEFSAADIVAAFKKYGARWADNFDAREIIKIEYENFSCTFEAGDVFTLLIKLQTAWQIPSAYRVKFVRKAETAPVVVCFDVPSVLNKHANAVAGAKDTGADCIKYVCVDTKRRAVVCCNGHALAVAPVENMYVSQDAKETYLIDPILLKAGKGTLLIRANGNAENGAQTRPVLDVKYPNWRAVCPSVSQDAKIFLGKQFAQIKKAVLAAAKFSNKSDVKDVILRGVAGRAEIEIIGYRAEYDDETTAKETRAVSVSLPQPCPYSFAYAFNGVLINTVSGADSLYFENDARGAYFADVARRVFVLIMPVFLDKTPWKAETFAAPAGVVSEIDGVCAFPLLDAENTPAAVSLFEELSTPQLGTPQDEETPAPVVCNESAAVITRNYNFNAVDPEETANVLPQDEETAAAAFEAGAPVAVSSDSWETEYANAAVETNVLAPDAPRPVLPAAVDETLYLNICTYLEIFYSEETEYTRAAYNYIISHGVKILFGEIYLHDNKIGNVKKEFNDGVCVSAVPVFDVAAVPEETTNDAPQLGTPQDEETNDAPAVAVSEAAAPQDEETPAADIAPVCLPVPAVAVYPLHAVYIDGNLHGVYFSKLLADEEFYNNFFAGRSVYELEINSNETAPAVETGAIIKRMKQNGAQDEEINSYKKDLAVSVAAGRLTAADVPAEIAAAVSAFACIPEIPETAAAVPEETNDAPAVAVSLPQDEETPAALIVCPDDETDAPQDETTARPSWERNSRARFARRRARRLRLRPWLIRAAAVAALIVCAAVASWERPAPVAAAPDVPAAVADSLTAFASAFVADSVPAAAPQDEETNDAPAVAVSEAPDAPAVNVAKETPAAAKKRPRNARKRAAAVAVADSLTAFASAFVADSVPAVAADSLTAFASAFVADSIETAPAVPADSVPAVAVADSIETAAPVAAVPEETDAPQLGTPQDEETDAPAVAVPVDEETTNDDAPDAPQDETDDDAPAVPAANGAPAGNAPAPAVPVAASGTPAVFGAITAAPVWIITL